MNIQITIDDSGDDVSVQYDDRAADRTPSDTAVASVERETLSAGRVDGGSTGFNPEGLPSVALEREGTPSQFSDESRESHAPSLHGAADESRATSGQMAAKTHQRAPPTQGQTRPIAPTRGAIRSQSDVFLGNEY